MNVLERFQQLETHASRLIIGQAHLINRMLLALLCDGHLLVEGAPGLAKTRAIKVLAESIEGDFHRLQFTPDLLPADLTGTDIYRASGRQFRVPTRSAIPQPDIGRRDQSCAGESPIRAP